MSNIVQMLDIFVSNFIEHYRNGDVLGTKRTPIKTGRKVLYSYSYTGGYALYSPKDSEIGLYVAYKRDEKYKTTEIIFEKTYFDKINDVPFERGGVFVALDFTIAEKLLKESEFIHEKFAALLLDIFPTYDNVSSMPKRKSKKPYQPSLF